MSRTNRVAGNVFSAYMQTAQPAFFREQRRTGRRAEGVRYERRVQAEFLERYPGYMPSPWIRFTDSQGEKWCQPDGLLINPWQGLLTIIEIKYQHTEQAITQLFGVYLPVVACLFAGPYRISVCEVVKWYDPALVLSRSPFLCKEPASAPPDRLNVYIWRP